MLIYCNGDSFTAGVGLCDHIFPDYPGQFTRDELKTKSALINKFAETKGEYYRTKHFKYLDLFAPNVDNIKFYDKPGLGCVSVPGGHQLIEKNFTYLAEMERLDPTIQTINSAKGGASMGGICNRTLLDLLNLKSKNIQVDRVIIQLTSIARFEIYDTNYKHFIFDRPLGHFNATDPGAVKISEAVLSRYTDNDYTIKFLYHLISIVEVIRSITGKPPIIIDSINGDHIDMSIRNARGHIGITNSTCWQQYEALVENSGIKTAHLNFMDNLAKNIERPYSYDGHFAANVHKETAVELLKLL